MRSGNVIGGLEIERDLMRQRALDVKGNAAPEAGDRPVQMTHEQIVRLARARDHVPFGLGIGELDAVHVAQPGIERRVVLEQQQRAIGRR